VLVSFPTFRNWWEDPVTVMDIVVTQGAFRDLAGNPSKRSNVVTVVLDEKPPTAQIVHFLFDDEVRPGRSTRDEQYLEARFSEDVLLSPEAVQVKGGEYVNGTFARVNGMTYGFKVRPAGTRDNCDINFSPDPTRTQACFDVFLPVGSFTDLAFNGNTELVIVLAVSSNGPDSAGGGGAGLVDIAAAAGAVFVVAVAVAVGVWRKMHPREVVPQPQGPPPPSFVKPVRVLVQSGALL
jgi:hypothetical protein